ncbi:MAG: hypothetical protein H0W48_00630 [Methylibium sp.]|nr:hypothetical protein [Methylibium sp.]
MTATDRRWLLAMLAADLPYDACARALGLSLAVLQQHLEASGIRRTRTGAGILVIESRRLEPI